jgi:hypothetical protein
MSRDIISVEVDTPCRSVPKWEEVLSRHVGKVPTELRDQEITKCEAKVEAKSLQPNASRPFVDNDSGGDTAGDSTERQQSFSPVQELLRTSARGLVLGRYAASIRLLDQHGEFGTPGSDFTTPLDSRAAASARSWNRTQTGWQHRYVSGARKHLGRNLRSDEQHRAIKRTWIAARDDRNGLGCTARASDGSLAVVVSRCPASAPEGLHRLADC